MLLENKNEIKTTTEASTVVVGESGGESDLVGEKHSSLRPQAFLAPASFQVISSVFIPRLSWVGPLSPFPFLPFVWPVIKFKTQIKFGKQSLSRQM